MNKFVLGGILAAISLIAIYGASASNRFTSWVDGARPSSAQTNTAQGVKQNDTLVALNSTEANDDAIIDVSGMTPLEKAGTLPQRQTIGATSNFGGTPSTPNTDDTDGEIIDATNPPNNDSDSSTDTADNNQNQNQTPAPEPIRALW
ncbi:MAG: hypothetical protein AAF959_07905 [Cyanobacteria bacterium P01_D01_bin.56]